jgi:hypothetical protein
LAKISITTEEIEEAASYLDKYLYLGGPKDQPGIDGGLMKREHPGASTTNTIDVPSVDEFISKITEAGGKIVAPKQSIPGVGYFAYCQDTEGNTFGIMEEDTSAK